MDNKELTAFAQTIGVAFLELRAKLDATTDAKSGESVEAIGAVANAINAIKTNAITVDLAALSDERFTEFADAVSGIEGNIDLSALTSAVAALMGKLDVVADRSAKVEAATQAQFTALAEQMKMQNDKLLQALAAPKMLIEENGKLVGVATKLN